MMRLGGFGSVDGLVEAIVFYGEDGVEEESLPDEVLEDN